MERFTKEDIGKRVLLTLDATNDPVSRALGAYEPIARGTIESIGESELVLKTAPLMLGRIPIRQEPVKIDYNSIIGIRYGWA